MGMLTIYCRSKSIHYQGHIGITRGDSQTESLAISFVMFQPFHKSTFACTHFYAATVCS